MTSTDGFLRPRSHHPNQPPLRPVGKRPKPDEDFDGPQDDGFDAKPDKETQQRYRNFTAYKPEAPTRDSNEGPRQPRLIDDAKPAAAGAAAGATAAGVAITSAADDADDAADIPGNQEDTLELPTDPVSKDKPMPTQPNSDATPFSEAPNVPKRDFTPEKKRRKPGKLPGDKRSKKKIALIVALIIIIPLLIYGAYVGYKTLSATSKVFKGNVLHALLNDGKPLKADQYGNTNVLIFGTSEDDPGHPGGNLTDSIMIASIDQKDHTAFMVSVPRDLWVKYGEQCSAGYQGKINAYYLCVSDDGKNETEGQDKMRKLIGDLYGVDIQYSVHINYAVVRSGVDALGGIDIVIESPDSRGILDRNFDWRCKYKCNMVKYPNGPAHLTGEQALFLAQARGEGIGYGLPRGNFDREANQRKMMLAAKDKAASAGFLANPNAVLKLVESMGENVRTNIDAEEIKTFIKVGKETNSANIDSISLVDLKPPALTTGPSPDGSTSTVQPTKGIFDYSGVQDIMKALLQGKGGLLKENAAVDVYNASDVDGVARKQASILSDQGIIIGELGTLPSGNYGKFKLYDLSGGKNPKTQAELEKVLGVKVTTETVPAGVGSESPFVLVVGQDPDATTPSPSPSSSSHN